MKKEWAKIIIFTFMMVFMASPTFANDNPPVAKQTIIVQQKQATDSVVAIGRDVDVKGTVQDAVIVLNGNVKLENKAQVLGMVIVIGGTVDQDPTAVVSDGVVNISLDSVTKNSFLIGSLMLLGAWFFKLILSLLLVVISLLTVFLAKDRLKPLMEMIQESPRRLIIIGIFTSILLVAISIALSISIIGVPIAVVLLLIVLVFFFLVLAACSGIVGGRISTGNETSQPITAIKGILALAAGFNFPLLGGLLFLCVLWLSLGTMTVWIWDRWKFKKVV